MGSWLGWLVVITCAVSLINTVLLVKLLEIVRIALGHLETYRIYGKPVNIPEHEKNEKHGKA